MAKFISISGPSTTGKTSLVNSLSTYPEMKNIIIGPDIHDVIWSDLVENGLFHEFTDVSSDIEYFCIYVLRMVDYYNKYLESYRDKDVTVLLDSCWLDFSIYSILQLWYSRAIKSVQEGILSKITKYDDMIEKIYITKAEDYKYPVEKYRIRGKMATFKANRPLEIQYYDIAKHLKNSTPLPSSDISESSLFIINDLKNLGYL